MPGKQWDSNPQPSRQLQPMTIKVGASIETITVILASKFKVLALALVLCGKYFALILDLREKYGPREESLVIDFF